jgi:hypothetical protein
VRDSCVEDHKIKSVRSRILLLATVNVFGVVAGVDDDVTTKL